MDGFVTGAGSKRAAAASSPAQRSKKPRDTRLRDCFTITPIEGGGESVVCKYCPAYAKTLQKFNPTKGRTHLTNQCPGVGEELRQILLETTQAAKRSPAGASAASDGAMPASNPAPPRRGKREKSRPSPAYISFHAGNANLASAHELGIISYASFLSCKRSHPVSSCASLGRYRPNRRRQPSSSCLFSHRAQADLRLLQHGRSCALR